MSNTTHESVGFRFISRTFEQEPSVGAGLQNSFSWDGDEQTEDELRGVCCFADQEDVEKYAAHSKGCGWVVTVGGEDEGRGDDFDGEIIIGEAIVLSVQEW